MTHTVDHEDGGIALNDSSKGMLYQRWRARLFDSRTEHSVVKLSAPNTPEFVILEAPNISEISFTFDRNMRLVLAYVQAGVAKMSWYDTLLPGQVTTTLGEGIITPRVSLDDKRDSQSSIADVILAYIRDGNLYYRQQRDRYQIERLLKTGVKPLIKIGMGRGMRFQFMSQL